jgi:hypothetical protein
MVEMKPNVSCILNLIFLFLTSIIFQTGLIYSFDATTGEGLQGVGLVKYMVEKHNKLVLLGKSLTGGMEKN